MKSFAVFRQSFLLLCVLALPPKLEAWYLATTMYFIGLVTLFFANNSLTECWITMELSHSSHCFGDVGICD